MYTYLETIIFRWQGVWFEEWEDLLFLWMSKLLTETNNKTASSTPLRMLACLYNSHNMNWISQKKRERKKRQFIQKTKGLKHQVTLNLKLRSWKEKLNAFSVTDKSHVIPVYCDRKRITMAGFLSAWEVSCFVFCSMLFYAGYAIVVAINKVSRLRTLESKMQKKNSRSWSYEIIH